MTEDNKIRRLVEACIDAKKHNWSIIDVADMFGIDDDQMFQKGLEALQIMVLRKHGKTFDIPRCGIRRENDFAELCSSQLLPHGRNLVRTKLPVKGENRLATDAKTAKTLRAVENHLADLLDFIQ